MKLVDVGEEKKADSSRKLNVAQQWEKEDKQEKREVRKMSGRRGEREGK